MEFIRSRNENEICAVRVAEHQLKALPPFVLLLRKRAQVPVMSPHLADFVPHCDIVDLPSRGCCAGTMETRHLSPFSPTTK